MNPELAPNKKIIPADQEGEKNSTEASNLVVKETPSDSAGDKNDLEKKEEYKMFNFAILDPRDPIKFPAAVEANNKVFESEGSWRQVFGIEVTVPELAKRCHAGNIDTQHGCHDETYDNGSGYMEGSISNFVPGEAAIEFVLRQVTTAKKGCWAALMIPPSGTTMVTVRADLDSVGSMALYNIHANGGSLEPTMERVAQVAIADKFARGVWSGPKPLPTRDNPWDDGTASAESSRPLAAIAAAVMDHNVQLADRVATMERWLLTGEEPKQYRDSVEKEREEMITALENGDIKHNVLLDDWCCRCNIDFLSRDECLPCPQCGLGDTRTTGLVALVESTHRAALSIGYALAPVVIAMNPALKLGGGEPHKKFTICQFADGFVDLKAVATELGTLEAGWGGSLTIIGSPQGVNSTLTMNQIVNVVANHLIS